MFSLYLIVAATGYLLGSIPFGYLLVKSFRGQDIRLSGSGNIGATNVARSGAKGLGITTLLLDAVKGALAVWAAQVVAASGYNSCEVATPCLPPLRLMALAGLGAVVGHMFPVWLGFKGGKGVATAAGVFAVLFPKSLGLALLLCILVVAATRYVSLGSILSSAFLPIAAHFVDHAPWRTLVLVSITCLLVILKHHQNIGRLLAGTENRFGSKKAAVSEKQA